MKKKITSLALVLALCLSLLPVTAFAEESETTEEPTKTVVKVEIKTVRDLQAFAKAVNDGDYGENTDLIVSLDADLDVSNISWTPIAGEVTQGEDGTYSVACFSGKFYGNGHRISGLDFSSLYGQEDYVGFFGAIENAEIYDLTIQGKVDVTLPDNGNMSFGSITGLAADSTISNCISEVSFQNNGKYIYGTIGMCGEAYGVDIEYCRNDGDITITGDMGSLYVGGIAGYVGDTSEINYCANTGDMTVNAPQAGGIVGQLSGNATMTNCYSIGKLTPIGKGTTDIGGIVGTVGTNTGSNNTISHCYFGGEIDLSHYTAVSPYGRFGGIVGKKATPKNSDAVVVVTFENNFFAKSENVSACGNDNQAGTAKSLDYMKTEDFYKEIIEGGGTYRYEADSTPLLPQPTHEVLFAITPANLTDVVITVDGEKVANPAELENGTHIFTVEAQNCKPFSGEFTVSANPETHTQTVAMTYLPSSSSSGSSRPRYDVTTPSKPENGSVTVDPERARSGSRVTVTVTPDSGYKLGELVVTDKDGKKLELTDKGNGQYTFTMPSGKVEVAAEFVKEVEVSPFADVATDAYYYDAVKWAVEKGVTNGVSETLFGPDQACTRAQIVTFLWRAAGSPEPKSGSSFADVAADAYYAKAVAWAVENGITKGTSETTFHPDETCTRAQGVTFLYRALGKLAAAQAGFTDVAADSYYADAVNWAAENGVTKGISETLFGPDGSCTRAQIVTFLYRAYQGK